MFLMNLLKSCHTCNHERASIDSQYVYCPDCGELIENEWYITRCACCGIKQKTIIKNGEIMPEANYCRNCGGNEYIIEKLEKIDFININYAVLVKTVVREEEPADEITQCWEEKTTNIPKLLQLFK